MKYPFLILMFICFSNCRQNPVNASSENNSQVAVNTSVIIDSVEVLKKALVLNGAEGKWYYKGEPFNGFSVKYYDNGIVQEKLGYLKGKREGVARRYSENGVLRMESHYHQNKLVGLYKCWWENGTVSEESNYINGVKQGVERQWFPNGNLAKLRQLVDGQEQGLQKAWMNTGQLYVNYEAKNGRVFGLMRSNSCYQLENEVVKRQ